MFSMKQTVYGGLVGALTAALLAGCGTASDSREGANANTTGESLAGQTEQDLIIAPGTWLLNGTGANLPDFDLKPLDGAAQNAKLMVLGEQAMTTETFSKMKLRLVKYLVRHHGYRAIGMRNGWDMVDGLKHYVDTCQGDVTAEMAGLYTMVQGEAVRDMFKFLCQWNASHPQDKVSFVPFGIGKVIPGFEEIRTYAVAIDPGIATTFATAKSSCLGLNFATDDDFNEWTTLPGNFPWTFTTAQHDACVAALGQIETFIAAHPASGATAIRIATYLEVIKATAVEYYLRPDFNTDSPDPTYTGGEFARFEIKMFKLQTSMLGVNKTIWWEYDDFNASAFKPQQYDAYAVGRTGTQPWDRVQAKALNQTYGDDLVSITLVSPKIEMNYVEFPNLQFPPAPTQADDLTLALKNALPPLAQVALFNTNTADPMKNNQRYSLDFGPTFSEPDAVYYMKFRPKQQWSFVIWLKEAKPMSFIGTLP